MTVDFPSLARSSQSVPVFRLWRIGRVNFGQQPIEGEQTVG